MLVVTDIHYLIVYVIMNNWEKDIWKTIQYKLKKDKEYEQTYLAAIQRQHDKRRSSNDIVRQTL